MVKQLFELAKSAKAAKNASAPMKQALATLKAHEHVVQADMARMEASQKKTEEELNQVMKAQMPAVSGDAAMDKGKNMLKVLSAQAHRKFVKARARTQNELKEIKAA